MNLFQQLNSYCTQNKISIVTAESCTAGLLASQITSVPGASSFFKGGFVVYSDQIKHQLLDVSLTDISKESSVSAIVAEQMACSARKKILADFSISTTGYAGPSGGTDGCPVGTVFIAISSSHRTVSKRFFIKKSRHSFVSRVVNIGVDFLIEEIKKHT